MPIFILCNLKKNLCFERHIKSANKFSKRGGIRMTKTGSILPEETLNAILRTGSNHNRTELRLIYNFMSVQTKAEYEEFVRNDYGNGGQGFIIDGKK